VEFCINAITLGEHPFPTSVEASASAGFKAIELWLPHVEAYLADGHTAQQARAVLDDHGVQAVGACFVSGLIASTGDAKRAAFDAAKERFELCQILGAPVIVCVGDGPADPTLDDYTVAAEQAREVGDLAASFGLHVAIEFIAGFPFIGTLATAARLVTEAEHQHLGILFDIFHFYAGTSKEADFATLDHAPISFVHLNDAAPRPREILRDADRLLPGHGCLPLADLAERIRHTGYDGYYSLELFHPEIQAMDPTEAAKLCYEACERFAQ